MLGIFNYCSWLIVVNSPMHLVLQTPHFLWYCVTSRVIYHNARLYWLPWLLWACDTLSSLLFLHWMGFSATCDAITKTKGVVGGLFILSELGKGHLIPRQKFRSILQQRLVRVVPPGSVDWSRSTKSPTRFTSSTIQLFYCIVLNAPISLSLCDKFNQFPCSCVSVIMPLSSHQYSQRILRIWSIQGPLDLCNFLPQWTWEIILLGISKGLPFF